MRNPKHAIQTGHTADTSWLGLKHQRCLLEASYSGVVADNRYTKDSAQGQFRCKYVHSCDKYHFLIQLIPAELHLYLQTRFVV